MTRRVIVVEDLFIANYLDSLLSPRGYAVALAGAERASTLLRTGPAVLVTNAPAEFLEFAEVTPLLYLSAAPDSELAARFHACRMVKKPFRATDLLDALEELSAEPAAALSSTES